MSADAILFPLAADETDLLMLLLALFILAVFIILFFLLFPLEIALFLTAVILLVLLWAIRESLRIEDSKKR
jgi:Na+/H+ antiporter NhaD/arsenite permease-like protein